MAEFTDYTSLVATAKSSLGRDPLPGAITLLTSQINKLRLREMLTEVSQTTLTLPSDFLDVETLKVGGKVYLPSHETAQARGEGGTYSVQGSEFLFNPAETAPDLFIRYYARVAVISGSETNDILLNYPEIYLFGMLANHARLARDEGGIAAWGSEYKTAIDDAIEADAASLMSAVSMRAMPRASA